MIPSKPLVAIFAGLLFASIILTILIGRRVIPLGLRWHRMVAFVTLGLATLHGAVMAYVYFLL